MYLHYSVATAAGQVLQSTRVEEGGAGLPLAFVIGKGRRVPRGWELAIMGVLPDSALLLHRIDFQGGEGRHRVTRRGHVKLIFA